MLSVGLDVVVVPNKRLLPEWLLQEESYFSGCVAVCSPREWIYPWALVPQRLVSRSRLVTVLQAPGGGCDTSPFSTTIIIPQHTEDVFFHLFDCEAPRGWAEPLKHDSEDRLPPSPTIHGVPNSQRFTSILLQGPSNSVAEPKRAQVSWWDLIAP